jgi:hypothetical protein
MKGGLVKMNIIIEYNPEDKIVMLSTIGYNKDSTDDQLELFHKRNMLQSIGFENIVEVRR